MYEYLFFDLDGTVTDSAEGIYNSVIFALEKLGYTVEDKNTLRPFIGPPLYESFREYYGFDDETAWLGVKYYREYYPEKGIFENRLYDGMYELLKELSESGRKLVLATSKPEPFAVTILEHFNVSEFFTLIAGSTLDNSRRSKTDVLRYALDECGITDKSTVLMIGDRKHDVIGAHEVGIDCAYVLYGFGSIEEAKEFGAEYIIEDMKELKRFLQHS